MLVRHKKPFNLGIMLSITFMGVLLLIFSPIFGDGRNGLQFSDDLFNKLSKGSSYFIPQIMEKAKKFEGTNYNVVVKLDNPENVPKAVNMFIAAGSQVGVEANQMTLSGDLGKLLVNVLNDSDAMYHNDGKKVADIYGLDEKEAMALWWNVLNRMDKELKKQKKVEDSNMVSSVMKKGVEPAYNYYGVEAQRVLDKAAVMTFLLVFYVAYTMWWGYAIFYLFDGMGLSMKKSKVKKEV